MSEEVISTSKTGSDASFYEYDNEKTILSLKLPQNVLTQWFNNRSIALFICLDISGSMAGSAINQAKQAILNLLEGLFTSGAAKEEDVTCFFFNNTSKEVAFANDSNLRWENGGIKRYFDGVQATGGTDFSSVFDSILNNINAVKTDLAVVFFSDGQTIPIPQEKKDGLAHALSHAEFGTEVHTIGFTGDHDAVILSWLTKLGTKQGNFQYVKTSSDIPNTMKTTLDLLALGDRNLFVKIGDNELLQTSINSEGRGRLVLTGEHRSVRDSRITVLREKQAEESFTFQSPRVVNPDEPEATVLTIPYIQYEITRLTNEVVANSGESSNRERLNDISGEAEEYDEKLNTILGNAFKIKSIWRSVTIQQCMEVKQTLHRFKDLLAEALKGSLTNEKIAEFNNLAYKHVTKQRLKKKLDERAIKNIDQMEAIEDKIQKLVKTIDFDKLENEESEENKSTFTCTLTTDNYIEAMKEGECMCLTLDVGRSPAAIADPTQLDVKKVNQTFLTSDAFLSSVRYALDETGEQENVHGGFEGSAFSASILKGLAREDITGILPIYLNEQHWQIAKERMKPIMGYITTLDVFGYSYNQVTTIPYLVLGRALCDTSLDFRRLQLRLILDTCDAIYKQSTTTREENKKLFENYTKSPLNRTIDVIANQLVLLGHLLCAVRCGDVTFDQLKKYLQDDLIKYAIEETLRRRLNRAILSVEQDLNNIQKLFGIEQKAYIDDPVNEFSKEYAQYLKDIKESKSLVNNRYANAFLAALSSTEEPKPMEVETPAGNGTEPMMDVDEKPAPTIRVARYNSSAFKVSEPAEKVLTKVQKLVLEPVEVILRYKALFEWAITSKSADIIKFPKLSSFKPDDYPLAQAYFQQIPPKARLATFLQAYAHRQNSVRREAAEAKPPTFYEPFSEKTSDTILAIHFDEFLSTKLKKEMNDIIDSYTRQENNAIGLNFWEATTSEEAAGLLLLDVKFRGTKVFHQIVKALQRPHMPLAREKLQMMVNGTWEGVKLFKDEFVKLPEKAIWYPSRINLYRTIIAQKEGVPDVEFWTNLIPSAKEYIQHQFDENYLARRRREAWELRKGITNTADNNSTSNN